MKKLKIYFNKHDVEDMTSEIHKNNTGIYDTHISYLDGKEIEVEIHLK